MTMKQVFVFLLLVTFVTWVVPGCGQQVDPNYLTRLDNYLTEAIAKGRISEAVSEFEKDAIDAEKANRHYEAAELYSQASRGARLGGNLQKALSYGQKAFEHAQLANDAYLQARVLPRIITTLKSLGKHTEARAWILKGIELVNKIPVGAYREGRAASFHNLMGMELLRTGEIAEAIEELSYSVQMRESLISYTKGVGAGQWVRAHQNSLIGVAANLASAYARAGMFDEAIRTYEKSVDVMKQLGSRSFSAASIYAGLGKVYLRSGNSARAEEYFQRSFESASQLQLSNALVLAASSLGDLLLQKSKPSEAAQYYKNAIGAIESSRSTIQTQELRQSFFEQQGRAYIGMILASLTANNAQDAFDYNERARSRGFLDILGTKMQLSRQATLAEEENSLRSRIAALGARVSGREEGEDGELADRKNLQRELNEAQKAYDAFVSKIRKENKEQASLMNVEPLTIKEVQERLDPGVTMLEYFVTNDSVIIWVVDKGAINSVTVPIGRKDLQSKVSSLRESIGLIGELGKVNQQAQELYRHLIYPASSYIHGNELLIIPHDVLHYLPFQALLSPQGKYLIEDYPISYLSSASLMQFTQEKRKARGELTQVLARGGKVLTFGNPDLGNPELNLSFAEIEAKEIKSIYPQSTIYLEKEATEEKAKALVGSSDIIHFASHAQLNENDPLASAILLAKSDKEDGRLEVREIFGMDLKASLVVLSACETGLGKLSTGDELVGLTRAFIYAGTPSVVASLWNVEDSSTAALMASLYKNLKTMTKVEALRQAQLQLIRGDGSGVVVASRGIGGVGKLGETPSSQIPASSSELPAPIAVTTSHPYFWAPFILVGDGK